MSKDLLSDIKEDIEFLLSFVPATKPEDVEEGLAPMFYITGSYQGDLELSVRVKEICEKYNIDLKDIDIQEDFSEDANA